VQLNKFVFKIYRFRRIERPKWGTTVPLFKQ